MADFRRLISYIYEYEGHVKGKNVGFVKLEARNGMCKLHVNVKKLYMGSGDMGVYLMTGRQEIFLGNIFLRNGTGEFRTMVQVMDVQESGETMDECYGLTIHGKGENWRIYTTIWEDAVAQAAQLTLESVTSEQVLEDKVEKGLLSPVIPSQELVVEGNRQEAAQTSVQKEKMAPEEAPKESQPPKPSPEEPLQESQLPKPSPEEPLQESQPPKPFPEEPLQESQLPKPFPEEGLRKAEPPKPSAEEPFQEAEPEKKEALDTVQQTLPAKEMPQEAQEAPQPKTSQNQSQRPISPAGTEVIHRQEPKQVTIPNFEMGRLEMETEHPDVPLGQQVQAPVIRQHKEAPLMVGDPDALARLDAEDASQHQMPVWDFFLKTYPKIQAFDSEYGCVILVIKPQDIGLLPREIWIYGNNSFLLHGYYNYRYLILARLENPHGKARYLLGIPGHYYSNEKYMASMFGFPHFVLSKKQTADDGRFGYWYTDVRMGDEAMLQTDAVKSLKSQAV